MEYYRIINILYFNRKQKNVLPNFSRILIFFCLSEYPIYSSQCMASKSYYNILAASFILSLSLSLVSSRHVSFICISALIQFTVRTVVQLPFLSLSLFCLTPGANSISGSMRDRERARERERQRGRWQISRIMRISL